MDTLIGLPEQSTCSPPTPPPAYCPRQVPSGTNPYLSACSARDQEGHAMAPCHRIIVDAAEAGIAAAWNNVDDYSDDEDREQSAIIMSISTEVRVSGDGNVLCISNRPAKTAQLIAEAVTQAIRQSNSEEHGGVPMIDEQGRPRPLRINIEAGLVIDGKRNVVASEANVVKRLLAMQCGSFESKMRKSQRHQRTRSASI